jgi:hypothetical protein
MRRGILQPGRSFLMICPACGNANANGISFCEFCGAGLRTAAIPRTVPAPPVQPAVPSAADVAQMGKSLLGSLTLGEKFAGAGTIAAVLGFFFPWISSPDLGPLAGLLGQMGGAELNHISLSGVDVAKFVGAVYLILLAAIAAGVLLYFARKAPTPQKLLMAGFLVMIGSLCGPMIIAELLFVPMIQSVAGFGLWLLGLGFSSIAAGGLITIATLGKTAR